MTRLDVLTAMQPLRRGAAVIIGPGLGGRLVASLGDDPLTIYNMDMAYTTSTALGVALGRPSLRVLAIEGDGSMLMSLASLITVARYRPANLIVLVFDNGRYLTTGSGTATSATTTGTDIARIAVSAGIAQALTVSGINEATVALGRAFERPGPWVIVAKIDTSDREYSKNLEPLPTDCYEFGQRFRRAALELNRR